MGPIYLAGSTRYLSRLPISTASEKLRLATLSSIALFEIGCGHMHIECRNVESRESKCS